jgi:hypothetical protein
MFLVAKLLTTASSVWTHLNQQRTRSTPMTKERILRALSDIREVGFQAWSTYIAEPRELATEHVIASDDIYVQANVYEDTAAFFIYSRETSHILANRRYSWKASDENATVFACYWVTEDEMSFLKTLGASERLLPNSAASLHGSLVDWSRQDDFNVAATQGFGSVERAQEVMDQVFEATRQKLGIVFEM